MMIDYDENLDSDVSDTESDFDDDADTISDEWIDFRLKMQRLLPHKIPPMLLPPLPNALINTVPDLFWYTLAEEYIFVQYDSVEKSTTVSDIANKLKFYYDM